MAWATAKYFESITCGPISRDSEGVIVLNCIQDVRTDTEHNTSVAIHCWLLAYQCGLIHQQAYPAGFSMAEVSTGTVAGNIGESEWPTEWETCWIERIKSTSCVII